MHTEANTFILGPTTLQPATGVATKFCAFHTIVRATGTTPTYDTTDPNTDST